MFTLCLWLLGLHSGRVLHAVVMYDDLSRETPHKYGALIVIASSEIFMFKLWGLRSCFVLHIEIMYVALLTENPYKHGTKAVVLPVLCTHAMVVSVSCKLWLSASQSYYAC